MRIESLYLRNFRGFEEIRIPFDGQFNLVIGDNGSGKTAILEALTVAMGSLFLGIRNADSRHIREADIRLLATEFSEEQQFPVVVLAEGEVGGQRLSWKRELNSLASGTLSRDAKEIKNLGEEFDRAIRAGEPTTMPVLAFYSTGRLWKDLIERKRSDGAKREISSRLRAYKSCLQATSTFKIFLRWFRGKELSSLRTKKEEIGFALIRDLVTRNLPNCRGVYFEFDPDKIQGLKIETEDGRTLPFEYLSDGARNMFALLADIAYRCIILNPHLEENSLRLTPGVVLIDELDLHLHPAWQKKIVSSLKSTFPSIQFITTSHSPFIIQETENGQLIKLKENQVSVSGANQLSIEDIAEYDQAVENPQWSDKKKDLYDAARRYFTSLANGDDDESLKFEVSELVKPYSQNPAFDAFIEQMKLAKENK